MAEITMQEMQRQINAYAMDVMFNRGLEAAALHLERRRYYKASDQFEAARLAAEIRASKIDPSKHMTDWWGDGKVEPAIEATAHAESADVA